MAAAHDDAACGFLLAAAEALAAEAPTLSRACGTRLLRRVGRAAGAALGKARRQTAALPILTSVCGGCGTFFDPARGARLLVDPRAVDAAVAAGRAATDAEGASTRPATDGGTARPVTRVTDLTARMDAAYTGTRFALGCGHCGMLTVAAVQHKKGVKKAPATSPGVDGVAVPHVPGGVEPVVVPSISAAGVPAAPAAPKAAAAAAAAAAAPAGDKKRQPAAAKPPAKAAAGGSAKGGGAPATGAAPARAHKKEKRKHGGAPAAAAPPAKKAKTTAPAAAGASSFKSFLSGM